MRIKRQFTQEEAVKFAHPRKLLVLPRSVLHRRCKMVVSVKIKMFHTAMRKAWLINGNKI